MAAKRTGRGAMGAAAWLAVALAASGQGLPQGTAVRVRNPSLGAGWLEGKVGIAANRCTMVFLQDKAPGGYTSMALDAITAMQKRDGAGWADVDVRPWLAKEPNECRDAAND